jgi:hypothetical protein
MTGKDSYIENWKEWFYKFDSSSDKKKFSWNLNLTLYK